MDMRRSSTLFQSGSDDELLLDGKCNIYPYVSNFELNASLKKLGGKCVATKYTQIS